MRAFVSDDIRLELEELMETVFKDPYVDGLLEEGIEKGRIEEAASALFTVLAARGISVLDQVRALVGACTDPEQLEQWISRAANATTIDEVFAA
jgi:hypothetical protein